MPTHRRVIKYSVHLTMHLHMTTASVSLANCLFTKQCDTPFDSKFCDLFLSVYGIKVASNSDLLIRSTQLKLPCQLLAVCT